MHIVRDPGGFLNSLTKRLWSKLDMEKVVRGNRDRLAGLAACHPIWAQRFGDIATLSAVESELWYWRYAVETIHEAGAGNPRDQLVKYEELTRNPTEISDAIYQGCGLEWNTAIEQEIQKMSGESQAIATTGRHQLDADQAATVERVLHNSVMQDWVHVG